VASGAFGVMKGIILAGGSGTRMHPMTQVAGIREILLISTPQDLPLYRQLLHDGSQWGIHIEYAEQPRPEGLAQAFIIGRAFLNGGPACLILGDNIFYGMNLPQSLRLAASQADGATIFAYYVKDPQRYGVVEFDDAGTAVSLEEKPEKPKSNYAVVGLYFYDSDISDIAAQIKPSARGELEITDVNRAYLERGKLRVTKLGRGTAWLDTGTPESLLQAASYVHAIESRQGLKISCPEEIAWRMGYVDLPRIKAQVGEMKGDYYDYVRGMQ
jgi:glucose-1-phosphate thymidylyltransferase